MKGCKGRHLIGMVSVMLMAGCVDSAPPAELRPSSSLQASAADAMPAPEAPPHPAPVVRKVVAPPTDATSAPANDAAPVGTQGVDRLIGLNETEIETFLGPPMLQEDRAPTKLWVFRNRSCTINVTLYPDVETRQFHALSYEVISDVHTAERTRQCIAEFSSRFSQR
jgi:hypothetical protein